MGTATMPRLVTRLCQQTFRGLALLLSVLLPLTSAPVPALAQAEANGPQADPPSIAGQLTRLSGAVSFHTADETTWQPADPNYPITSGNALWTEPGAGASVVFGANRIAMDGATELDVNTLDQHRLVAAVPQGTVFLNLRNVQPGDEVSVATPRGTVTIGQPGVYEIASGDQATPTRVTVQQGAAQVYGSGVSSLVQAGQTATITGSSPFVAALGPAQNDPFLAAQFAAAPMPPQGGVAPPVQVAQMTGGSELEDVGSWQNSPQYGTVWYPPVSPGWVPYQDGHWAWVAPWGWTWVDNAPWGFAPFHYGRWIMVGPRWAWVPVAPGVVVSYAEPPVYAPALVAFFGIGVVVGAVIASGRPVGWCPLAPYEPYHPWYHASPAYVRNVNRVYVRNVNTINVNEMYRTTSINRFANHNAVTVVNSQVMSGSRQVRENLQHGGPGQFDGAHPFTSAPVHPTTATAGLTPNVARQYGMTPVRPQRPAPGPVVRPAPAGAPVPLRPPGGAPVVHPAITGPGGTRPAPGPSAPNPSAPGATLHGPTNPAVQRPLAPPAPQAPRAPQATPAPQAPHAPGPQAPSRPGAVPQGGAPQPPRGQAPQAPQHLGAPGPAITPHPNGALPPLRPAQPVTPHAPGQPAPQQHYAPPQQPTPQQQRYAPQQPVPQQQRYAPQQPVPQQQRYAPQQPVPQQQRYAPQQPTPQQHYAPPQQPVPQQQRYAPPPQQPVPQQHYAPPQQPVPQQQRYAPPPQQQQRYAPQQQRYNPPPQQRVAPQPMRYAPPPQPHYAPPVHYAAPPPQHYNPPARQEQPRQVQHG